MPEVNTPVIAVCHGAGDPFISSHLISHSREQSVVWGCYFRELDDAGSDYPGYRGLVVETGNETDCPTSVIFRFAEVDWGSLHYIWVRVSKGLYLLLICLN
ncbi:uncharacterized protein PGTG_20092 [Puccinia graminis f. sp. tritici CRL 75-36-700-3]|uniref:Uncharacterized protein n=1 Tax=Puccinia graminis f. sp. tritici (strain CRL 75-36-700-3 / race SCCL) TaxID=418459 RepID=E3NX93_PUCGT|nr:uncharacterized protein PGTG_20092 [Puccinia graminis f. sp. tritici CRL 75-36-700-3]EFP94192.1 hypothetical protein PGTG_20092 [Puccinia graminis f. sp. tritici CRL 75-36-700-3]